MLFFCMCESHWTLVCVCLCARACIFVWNAQIVDWDESVPQEHGLAQDSTVHP